MKNEKKNYLDFLIPKIWQIFWSIYSLELFIEHKPWNCEVCVYISSWSLLQDCRRAALGVALPEDFPNGSSRIKVVSLTRSRLELSERPSNLFGMRLLPRPCYCCCSKCVTFSAHWIWLIICIINVVVYRLLALWLSLPTAPLSSLKWWNA